MQVQATNKSVNKNAPAGVSKINKPFFSAVAIPPVRSDVAVSADNMYEAEADKIAGSVMQASANRKIQTKSAVSVLKSSSAGKKISLQNYQGGGDSPGPSISERLKQSAGDAMEPVTKGFMEARFQVNFSDVKIHTDTQAQKAASAIKAKAFTYGNHIFFNKGMYQPETNAGRYLLAHELAHTMQQSGGFKVIQKKDENSVTDIDVIKNALYTPAFEHILQLHRSASASNKKITTLADTLSLAHTKPNDRLWEEAKQLAEAAVVPSQEKELDLLFDVYKFLGKHGEAKNLAKAKKYKPLKTAFYNPDFYKEVLKGDMGWLPAHPILKPFFPDDFVDTFRAYLYNPYAQGQALPKKAILDKQIATLLSQQGNNSALLDNETSLIALEAFAFLESERKVLMEFLDKEYKTNEKGLSSKIEIAKVLSPERLNKAMKKLLPDESFSLLKFAEPLIQKVANDALAFWNNIDRTNTLLLGDNTMVTKSIMALFKTFNKEFAKFQKPLEAAAITFLELTPSGNIPARQQFDVQRLSASRQLHTLIAEAGNGLVLLNEAKMDGAKKNLADCYGIFINFLSHTQYYTTDNEFYKSGYANGQNLNRYGFGAQIKNIGVLLNFEALKQIGDEVLNPTGKGLFGGVQSEIFIAFDGDLKAEREALSPQQVFSEFGKELGAGISDSAYMALFLQAFIRNALIAEETELLKKELQSKGSRTGEKIEDYKPLQQRVNEKIKNNALSVDSVIPALYHIKTIYYTIPKSKAGKLADFLFANSNLKAFFAGKFPHDQTFMPDANERNIDKGGIRLWTISNTSFQKFSAAMRKLFPDIITEEVGGNNFVTAYTMLLNRLVEEEKKLNGKPAPKDSALSEMQKKSSLELIEEPQAALFALRRKALSDNRGALNKLLITPLWDAYQENTAHIDTWSNPLKAIDAMVMLGGDLPLLIDKRQQHELKLQITADLLELGPLIYKRLFKQGTFNATTNRIDIIVKLLPQVVGALSLEKEAEKNRVDLDLDFEPAEHAGRVITLKTLQEGLTEILHNLYETEKTELLNLNNGNLLDKVYVGEWLETDGALGELRDRNSNIPFKKNTTILYEGKNYRLLEINQNFHYKPAIELDASHVDWPKGMVDDINPSVLILGDERTPKTIARTERKESILFKYSVVSANVENTQIIEVHGDNDELLRNMKAIISINSTRENLNTLGEVLETEAAWISLPFYFIPGLGEAVLAGDIVVGVMQFITSPEFSILKSILNGDGPALLEESFGQVKSLFKPDELWSKLMDENFELPTFIDPKPKTADSNDFNKKSDGKLKKFLYSIIRFGKKLMNGLSGLKSLFNYALKKIHYFILNRPFLAGAFAFVAEHFQTFVSAFKLLDKEDETKPEEPNLFVAGIDEMLGNLTELEIPLNLIPLDVVIDFVVRIALKSLKGPKGIIAGSVKSLLEKTGIYDKVLKLVGKELSGTWIDPNKYINELINDKLQPLVQEASTGMADEITNVLQKIPGFEGVKMPTGPKIKEFKDSKDSYEDEEVPEANPFPAANFSIGDVAAIPAHPSGGTPLNKEQSSKFSGDYGHDFSHVRVHTDAAADAATRQTGAMALTSGSHIYLSSGLSPASNNGDNILRHELGHVLQQTGPRPVFTSHSSASVAGKPGRGIIYNQQKEAEADNFANGNSSITFSNWNAENEGGVFPKLSDSVFKLFQQITKDPDSKLKLHATKAPLTNADKLLSNSLPGIIAAAFDKMTVSGNLAPGLDLIKNYLKAQNWRAKGDDFLKLVEISKVPKKLGKITEDENDWKFKVPHLELALEQYIAVATGVLIDIEFADAANLGSFKKFNIDNLFLENVSDDAIYQLLITNTFSAFKSPGLKTKYNTTKNQDYIKAARTTIKELMPKKVFAKSNFHFTNPVAKAIEFTVNANSGTIHTGEENDPIEIRWTKTGHHSPIRLQPLKSAYPAPEEITANMRNMTKVEVPSSQKDSFPETKTEIINGKQYYTLEIGVKPKFMYKIDKVMQRTPSGERVMQNRFKLLLEHHGYDWTGYSPDHLQDLGFGDATELDVTNNFWPLEGDNLNEQTGNKVYKQRVMYKDTKDAKDIKEDIVLNLYKKWFVIKSIGVF